MCEFTGLDFEMEIKQHYHEVLAILSDLFVYVFDQLNTTCQKELAAVQAQYPFKPLRYNRKTLILPFSNAVKMLQDAGEDIGPEDDFSSHSRTTHTHPSIITSHITPHHHTPHTTAQHQNTSILSSPPSTLSPLSPPTPPFSPTALWCCSTPQEKHLGRLVSEKYGVDFYIVDQYPLSARPFYTMPSPSNPRFTNSYDVFVRGEEITSGAQRIHDVELQVKRAKECGIPESSYRSYVEAFKYGAWPHGGAGIGLERVVMLFLGLDNIRKSSLFPRTPNRYTP